MLIACVPFVFITCSSSSDDDPDENGEVNVTTTISGILNLPLNAVDKTWAVAIDTDTDPDNGFIASELGVCNDGTKISYNISDVPSGTYYLYAFVYVLGDLDNGLEFGDYLGIYGGEYPFDMPASPNVHLTSGNRSLNINLDYYFGEEWNVLLYEGERYEIAKYLPVNYGKVDNCMGYNFDLYLLTSEVEVEVENNDVYLSGNGEGIYFEVFCSDQDGFTVGNYIYDVDYKNKTQIFDYGRLFNIVSSDLTLKNEIDSGTLILYELNDGKYGFIINCTDEYGQKVFGALRLNTTLKSNQKIMSGIKSLKVNGVNVK